MCFLWKASSWTVLQASLIPIPHPDQFFLSRADAKKLLLLRNNLITKKLSYKILVLLSSHSPIPPSKEFYIPDDLLGLF